VKPQHRIRSPRLALALGAFGIAGALAACSITPDIRSGNAIAIGGTTTIPTDSTDVPLTTDTVPVDTTPVVDTEAPTTTAEPTTTVPLECLDASNLPALVAAESGGYDGVQSQEGLGASDERRLVMFTSGGAVAVQTGSGESRSIEYRIGPKGAGGPKGTIKKAVLYDLLLTKQGPAILYGSIDTSSDTAVINSISLFDLGSGESAAITSVTTGGFNAFRAAAGNGLVVASARTESGQETSTWAIDGKGVVERFSPATAHAGSAQFIGPAVLSPDSKQIAWFQGPDPSKKGTQRKGSWVLVVADAESGDESMRVTVAPASDNFTWLDWDGSWAVLSRGFGKPAVAVHTTERNPELQNICNVDRTALLTGAVTLVRRETISTDSGIA